MRQKALALAILAITAAACHAQFRVGDFGILRDSYTPMGATNSFSMGDVVRVVEVVPPSWVKVVGYFEKSDRGGLQILANKLSKVSEEEADNAVRAIARRNLVPILLRERVISEEDASSMSLERLVEVYSALKKAKARQAAEMEAVITKPSGPSFIYPDGRVIVNGQCVGKAKSDGRIIYNDGSYGGRIMSGGRLIDEEGNYVGQVTGGGVLPSR